MTINPDIVNLSGRVNIHQEPLWEVPMDAVSISFPLFHFVSMVDGDANAGGVFGTFVGSFSALKVFTFSIRWSSGQYQGRIFDESNGRNLLYFCQTRDSMSEPPTPGRIDSFNYGAGIVANSSYIYIPEYTTGYVHVFDHNGVFQFWFDKGGSSVGPGIPPGPPLDYPRPIGIDSSRLYVGEIDKVSIFDHSGSFISSFYSNHGKVAGAIGSSTYVSVNTPGSGYVVGDLLRVVQNSSCSSLSFGGPIGTCAVRVSSVINPGGHVSGVTVYHKGSGGAKVGVADTVRWSSSGTGCKINIIACEFSWIPSQIATDGSLVYVNDNVCKKFSTVGSYQGDIFSSTGWIYEYTIINPGTGYQADTSPYAPGPGSQVIINGGIGTARLTIQKVGVGGTVEVAGLFANCDGFTSGTTYTTTTTYGPGSGLTIRVDKCVFNLLQGVTVDSNYVYLSEYNSSPVSDSIKIFDKVTSVPIGIIGPNSDYHKSGLDNVENLHVYNNKLYVAGQGVQKLDIPSGTFIRRYEEGSQYYGVPWAFCFTGTNTILIADQYHGGIKETDLAGNVINTWPLVNAVEDGSAEVAYGPPPSTGYIGQVNQIVQSSTQTFIADGYADNVTVFDLFGNFLYYFKGTGLGGPLNAFACAVDATRVYITGGGRVHVYTHAGVYVTHFDALDSPDGSFISACGIAVDASHIYVCDSLHYNVKVFDLLGNFQYSIGSYGTNPNQFTYPYIIDVGDGYLFVTDLGNMAIKVFDTSGTFLVSQPVTGFFHGEVRYNSSTGVVYYS